MVFGPTLPPRSLAHAASSLPSRPHLPAVVASRPSLPLRPPIVAPFLLHRWRARARDVRRHAGDRCLPPVDAQERHTGSRMQQHIEAIYGGTQPCRWVDGGTQARGVRQQGSRPRQPGGGMGRNGRWHWAHAWLTASPDAEEEDGGGHDVRMTWRWI
nr:unnamed protein product [Digitaria exilis]